MKGPGLRIDVDVRRAWSCPVCGLGARLTMDITAPRCSCVRGGVPMKLAEGQRPGRLDLRPELRSMLDRIQAGEEFARMTSPLMEDAESGPGGYGSSKSRNRPPRTERSGDYADRRPRESHPTSEWQNAATTEPLTSPESTPLAVEPPRQSPAPPDEDDFGAGLGVGETSTPQ
ncbi:MAG: hypothetical protein FJ302_07815 [Planctomycetes bacterium]|nr:hypothetical protein [Planctomycetota bacterium]